MSTVDPYDEKEILADDCIIRRINPVYHIIQDENRGCRRISSAAFKPSSGENAGMSVDIEAKIVASGLEPRRYVTTPVFTGSVCFSAQSVRDLGLWIGYDPLPENEHHGEVWGNPRPNRFTKSQVNDLQGAAEWYVPLEGVAVR